MSKKISFFSLFLTLIILSSCQPDNLMEDIQSETTPFNSEESQPLSDEDILAQYLALPATAFNYANPNLPRHFTGPNTVRLDNTPANNPITNQGATLGRVLFYDVNLSANNTISCASCHQQANGFSDPAQLSLGFAGELTGRHSMGLANARYYENGHFFWDERAATLEEQVLIPIQDHIEMGMALDELIPKLQAQPYYPILFEHAFGDSLISSERIALALSQFVRAMVSYQSKFDTGLSMTNGPAPNSLPNFTDLENLGLQIFTDPQRGACAGCHAGPLQIGIGAQNNGLDRSTTDQGLGAVTGNPQDDGKFKSPSLRNIAVTAPYMHDGRFATLAEVIAHYNSGVQQHPNLDGRLRVGAGSPQPKRLNLTPQEKEALEAFLHTLTDEAFLTSELFADPFVR